MDGYGARAAPPPRNHTPVVVPEQTRAVRRWVSGCTGELRLMMMMLLFLVEQASLVGSDSGRGEG